MDKNIHLYYQNPESDGKLSYRSEKVFVEKGSADSRPDVVGRYDLRADVPSSEYSQNNAWNVNYNGNNNNNNKNNNNYVRSVRALAANHSISSCPSLFDQTTPSQIRIEDLFQAYYDCRRNKRRTSNAMAYEVDFERNLVELYEDINNGTYQIGASLAFIVQKPVKREVFAADFRDRIVHHFVINKINPIFEKLFINDSYSCRKGKSSLYGITQISEFIRRCSQNYTRDAYILKLDIEGFFMHIRKDLLFNKIRNIIEEQYFNDDKSVIIGLCRQIIYNNPTLNCRFRGSRSNWKGLPHSKSLFGVNADCGQPIGNLSSQIFANVYLDALDKFVTHTLQFNYYGRYVDDFIIIHHDK